MCNCNSPWAVHAQNLLALNNRDAEWHTVNFLYNNHCGIDNRTSIVAILDHLLSVGYNFSREEFQQGILGNLKAGGIVATLLYPGGRGGVYIPCSDDEVKIAAHQVLSRVFSELSNLEGTTHSTNFAQPIIDLIAEVQRTINSI